MLLNMTPDYFEESYRMLTLLCCAKRPLTVPELFDGLSVELGNAPKFNPGRRLETPEDIHKICPGFIEIDMQPYNKESIVRIAHFSVQEYLESGRLVGNVAKFSIQKRQAHTDIACICLTYLLEPGLPVSKNQEEEYPLARYAAKTWHEHFHDADRDQHLLQLQLERLFKSTSQIEAWASIWDQ